MEEKLLQSWFTGFNQRDWDSIQNIYTEDALIHGKEELLRGGKSVVEMAKKWLFAIPDAHITPLSTIKEKDFVVVHWRVEGTFTNPIRDIAATGRKVVFHGLTCFRFDSEKVVEHWASVDYRPLRFSRPVSAL